MEKEIIGYRLKEEYKKYSKAAFKICTGYMNEKGLVGDIGFDGDIKKLKEAGVLDLWFEPVYKDEEYKVGDWCYIINRVNSKLEEGKVYKINQIDMSGLQSHHFDLDFKNTKHNSCWLSKSSFRKATKSEIEETLLTEAKKRYPKGTKFISLYGSKDVSDERFKIEFNDDNIECISITASTTRIIYSDGKWAEIIETTPNITINGYKAEFFEDYVKFGCAEINKEVFIDLVEAKDYSHTNRQIESVTIGRGTFSKEQIKTIVEYYGNK